MLMKNVKTTTVEELQYRKRNEVVAAVRRGARRQSGGCCADSWCALGTLVSRAKLADVEDEAAADGDAAALACGQIDAPVGDFARLRGVSEDRGARIDKPSFSHLVLVWKRGQATWAMRAHDFPVNCNLVIERCCKLVPMIGLDRHDANDSNNRGTYQCSYVLAKTHRAVTLSAVPTNSARDACCRRRKSKARMRCAPHP